MAGNDWINGYLEAILDVGNSLRKRKEGNSLKDVEFEESMEKDDNNPFNPTKYFVEEVVNSFDESDLHRTWVKVIATRNTREKSNRLENMCWRIWHLARLKKKIEWDDAQRLAKRRVEREKGRNDAADDLSELSEGEKEKEKGESNVVETAKEIVRINSDMQMWSDEEKPRRLYIVLIRFSSFSSGLMHPHITLT